MCEHRKPHTKLRGYNRALVITAQVLGDLSTTNQGSLPWLRNIYGRLNITQVRHHLPYLSRDPMAYLVSPYHWSQKVLVPPHCNNLTP